MKKQLELILFCGQEEYEYPYLVDKVKYENYQKLLLMVAGLKGKGMCSYTYDSIYHPYLNHSVTIMWAEDNGMVEMGGSMLATLCSLVDTVVIDLADGTWMCSSAIFKKGEKLNGKNAE